MKLRREFSKSEMNRLAKWRSKLTAYGYWTEEDERMFKFVIELVESHNSLFHYHDVEEFYPE